VAASSREGNTSPDEALAKLADVRASVTGHFGAHHEVRLGQFTAAIDTAVMAVEHLIDEEAREVDLANRIVARDTVHGQHEATSPVGRTHSDTLRIAKGN
jgi:membrane-bound lytic murein transglycosylase MltF